MIRILLIFAAAVLLVGGVVSLLRFPEHPSPPPPLSPFGIEINRGHVSYTLDRAREANVAWVRYNAVRWSEVEPVQGERNWSELEEVDEELRALAEHGITTVVIVRGTPEWAQQVAGVQCSPIRAEHLDAFADFLSELVRRYHAPPYRVQYWEIWNEPDVDPSLIPAWFPFGCWGDRSDPDYGGEYFATMLKRAYPAIKQANPQAQVVLGGLALDCDPTHPPPGQDCKPARFLEGILKSGGGEYFDILAYHSYAFWDGEQEDWERNEEKWQHRGGAMLGRLDYLRTVLHRHGIEKPIVLNEGSLLCYESNPACFKLDFLEAQANYVIRFHIRAWANGLAGGAWYTLNDTGWNESGMMGRGRAVRPAYEAFRFLSNLLSGARYIGTISAGQVEGYAFRKGDMRYDVYWTNDDTLVDMPIPAHTRMVYDKYGHGITPRGDTVTISFEPLVLERGVGD